MEPVAASRSTMRGRAAAAAWLLLLGVATAQQARSDKDGDAGERRVDPRTSSDVWSESTSRELFTACDGDGDDRLDLFEANEALDTLGDPKDSRAFLRLDADRDGFLTWPEFDDHFRAVVQRGGILRVRTCRRLVTAAPEQQSARPATPIQRVMQLHDRNDNGGLDPDEIEQLLRLVDLPPAFASQLKALDLDHSGRLEEAELAPLFERLRGRLPLPGGEAPRPASELPPPWSTIDRNGDARIDTEEFAQGLRRIDPSLARWAAQLLQRLDRDKDGAAAAAELPVPQPGGKRDKDKT
jgi:Ca2+-binding EF-hand superfamily protein